METLLKLYRQKLNPPIDPNADFSGRTVIVTGSNTGLGREAASKFADLGAARVILAVRSLEKGRVAAATITNRLAVHDKKTQIDVWQLDMVDYDSIRAFVKKVDAELERLDVVVLNAGVYCTTFEASKYGWEQTLQVNTLSTTLLAMLLLPVMQKHKVAGCEPQVLELVSSGRHYALNLSEEQQSSDVNLLEDFNVKERFAAGRQYVSSKLFLMCALESLSKLVSPEDVVVTSVCPGACQSDLSRAYQSNIFMRMLLAVVSALLLRTSEQGARTLVSGTTLGEKGHGRFWQHDTIRTPAPLLQEEEVQKKVWYELVDALRKDVPEVMENATL